MGVREREYIEAREEEREALVHKGSSDVALLQGVH